MICFTCVFFEGHLFRSKSSIKVTFFTKTLTLGITFVLEMKELSYFTFVFLEVSLFCGVRVKTTYQDQGQMSGSQIFSKIFDIGHNFSMGFHI